MGKPQSNFQYRTIFGVPLIAGNGIGLGDGRQRMNLIFNRDVSGGYCKTAVSRWPFSQYK
jgi:hypothetical protein